MYHIQQESKAILVTDGSPSKANGSTLKSKKTETEIISDLSTSLLNAEMQKLIVYQKRHSLKTVWKDIKVNVSISTNIFDYKKAFKLIVSYMYTLILYKHSSIYSQFQQNRVTIYKQILQPFWTYQTIFDLLPISLLNLLNPDSNMLKYLVGILPMPHNMVVLRKVIGYYSTWTRNWFLHQILILVLET